MKSTGKKYKRPSKKGVLGFIIVLVITILLAYFGIFARLIDFFKDYGYLGVYLTGIFYGYSFAAFPACIMFIFFSKSFNPFLIAFFGSLGVMTENLIVFLFFKKTLNKNIENISNHLGFKGFSKIRKSSKWVLSVCAAIVFFTPLPNEIAIYLLSLEEVNPKIFLIFSFLSSFFGILLLTGIGLFL